MYVLRPSVRACVDQDAVVFLDLKRDRYLSIDAASAPEIHGVCVAGTGKVAAALVDRGCVEPKGAASASSLRQRAELMGELNPHAFRHARPNGLDWSVLVFSCTQASIGVRSRRLDRVFLNIERRKRTLSAPDLGLADTVAAFETMRPWYPRRRVCLFDSLALMNFLLVRGHIALLVLGIRAKPFSAHCWIEADGVCLNDAAENCRAYTAIASV